MIQNYNFKKKHKLKKKMNIIQIKLFGFMDFILLRQRLKIIIEKNIDFFVLRMLLISLVK